jgi:hypothetical protein
MNGLDRMTEEHPLMCTTKIRFTAPQIAFLRRAHPDCNLDGVVELTFFFDQDGHLIHCTGKIEGDDTERDYAGLGLILTYEMACRGLARRSHTSAEILQFPGGSNA